MSNIKISFTLITLIAVVIVFQSISTLHWDLHGSVLPSLWIRLPIELQDDHEELESIPSMNKVRLEADQFTPFPFAKRRIIVDLISDPEVILEHSEVFQESNFRTSGMFLYNSRCRIGLVARFKNAYIGQCGSITTPTSSFMWNDFDFDRIGGHICGDVYWRLYGRLLFGENGTTLWKPTEYTENCRKNGFTKDIVCEDPYPRNHPIEKLYTKRDPYWRRGSSTVFATLMSTEKSIQSALQTKSMFSLTKSYGDLNTSTLIPVLFTWGDHFPHIIKDILPRLTMVLKTFREDKSTVLLLPEGPVMKSFVRLLQLEEDRIVFIEKGSEWKTALYTQESDRIYYAEDVLLPICWPGTQSTGHYSKTLYKRTRTMILNHVNRTGAVDDLIVYASRKGGYNMAREIDNEDAFVKALKINFGNEKVVHFIGSKFNLEESFELFSRAKVVVGPHGGALYNVVACKEGTNVIELTPDDYGRAELMKFTNNLNLVHHRLMKWGMTKNDMFGSIPIDWTISAIGKILRSKEQLNLTVHLDDWDVLSTRSEKEFMDHIVSKRVKQPLRSAKQDLPLIL